jgi:hypothetical protein
MPLELDLASIEQFIDLTMLTIWIVACWLDILLFSTAADERFRRSALQTVNPRVRRSNGYDT